MKKCIVSLLLILTLIFCGSVPVFSDSEFNQWDSTGGYPADVVGTRLLAYVAYLMDKGIITGDDDGLFHPEKNISRAEFATMMAKATNNISELDIMKNMEIFNDLEGYGWAKPYINAVAQADLFKGRGKDRFAPGENVTYAEVVTVLIRLSEAAADTAERMAAKWPDNYIAYAITYNMMGDIVVNDWNSPATKGDVAQMLYKRIPKESTKKVTATSVKSVTVNWAYAALTSEENIYSIKISGDDAIIEITTNDARAKITCNSSAGLGTLLTTVSGIKRPYAISFKVELEDVEETYWLYIN